MSARRSSTAPCTAIGGPVGHRGFTLIELLIGVVLVGLLVIAVSALTRGSSAITAGVVERSSAVSERKLVDTRLGEVARTVPQYGDLSVVSPSALAFRKMSAPNAAVCSYTPPNVRVQAPTTELAGVTVGDSIAVRTSNGTHSTSDDVYALAVITSTASTGTCNAEPTLTATLVGLPAAGTISPGASVRIWNTRRYQVEAAPAGYNLVEYVNGQNAAPIYGPFDNNAVFTYFDASSSPAAAPAAIRLVRARFIPLQPNQRQLSAVRAEYLEWPIAPDGAIAGQTAGDVPEWANPSAPVARCTTAGAPNFGSTTAACCAGPWTKTSSGACGYGYNTGSIAYQQDLQANCSTWGPQYETSNSCACTLPTSTTSSTSCAAVLGNANWSGSVNYRQDRNPDCATYGAAVETDRSCSCSLAASETQPKSCTWGPSITTVRYSDSGSCTWGAWQDVGACWNSPPCPTNPSIQTSDPACSSINISLSCSGLSGFAPEIVQKCTWSVSSTYPYWGYYYICFNPKPQTWPMPMAPTRTTPVPATEYMDAGPYSCRMWVFDTQHHVRWLQFDVPSTKYPSNATKTSGNYTW